MALSYTTIAKPHTLSRVLAWETHTHLSREGVTVLAGDGAVRELLIGTVLGQRTLGDVTITPDVGNTGDGALGSLTLGALAVAGVYVMTCIAEAANGGTFQVVDPNGFRLADATVAVAYAQPQIAFTITDGANDWDIGDVIEVEVAAGDKKVVALDLTATDGTQHAFGALAAAVTAAAGVDAPGQAIHRFAGLIGEGLVWPAGITTDQKSAALAELAARNLVILQGV